MIELLSRTEESLYSALFEKTPLGVAVIDAQGIVVWLNALAKDFLGSAADAGRVMLSSKDWPRLREFLQQDKSFFYPLGEQGFIFIPQNLDPITSKGAIRELPLQNIVESVEAVHEPPNQSWDEAIRELPLPQDNKRTLLWIIPSVSMEIDLLKMQHDLIQQRKLANLGRMMSEMAHELNNPLAGISMGCQLIGLSLRKLRKLLSHDEPQKDVMKTTLDRIELELEKITNSTARAATLRQEVLAYSKPDNTLSLKPYQTRNLIQLALNSFESHPVFRNMVIHKEFAEKSSTILCDPSKMEQIFYNLVKNAYDATEGKGEIWIREIAGENEVTIEIEDNGSGIPEDLLDKVFSPFLTTKARTGSGLGLSISQHIIVEHGGTISVYNKANSGACFQIKLPIRDELSLSSSV